MARSSADPSAFIALGMQSAKGTPQVTAAKLRFIKYLSGVDVQPALEIVDLREGGDGLDFGYSYKKSQKVGGQIVLNARPEAAGQLLQILPGGATWDGGSAPAIHTYHAGHASFPWATILSQHPASDLPLILSDVRFTGFTLEMSSGEPWKFTFPFVGINLGASYAGVVPSYANEEPLLFHHSPTYVLDGLADSTITAVRIEQGLGIEELQSQAVTLDDISVMNRDTNVEITRRFPDDAALWKKINLGASAGISPTTSVATGALRAAVTYGSGAGQRSLDVECRLLSYRAGALTEMDPDGKTVMETISAKALKGATHALFATLKNAHASAYAS